MEKNQGEGNVEADRRYRQGVRETTESTTHDARAEQARKIPDDHEPEAEKAAEEAQSKAKR